MSDERSDVNSSPVISAEAIVVGCDDGTIVRVPFDYPLSEEGRNDPRCITAEVPRTDGAALYLLSRFGKRQSEPPKEIDANQPVNLSLVVREHGVTQTTLIDPRSLKVTSSAGIPLESRVSADKRFVTVIPRGLWATAEGGGVHVSVRGRYKVRPRRFGLKMFGGRDGGSFDRDFAFAVRPRSQAPFPFIVADGPGTPCSVLEVGRLAPAMPTILPSYNQLGFDSIHYHLGVIERTDHGALLWGVGAKLVGGGEDRSEVDPGLAIRFAVHLEYDGGLLTLLSEEGFTLEFNGWDIPYDLFRVSTSMEAPAGRAPAQSPTAFTMPAAWINARVRCDDIRFYGPFLKVLGVSDFRTGMMEVAGAAGKMRYLGGRRFDRGDALGTAQWHAPKGPGPRARGAVAVSFAGSQLKAGEHNLGILLVHAESGAPLAINYTKVTTVEAGVDGRLACVSVEVPRRRAAGSYRAYLMVDGLPALREVLEL